MKKGKMAKVLLMTGILSLVLAGCGNKAQEGVERTSEPESVESTPAPEVVESTPEPESGESIPTPEVVEGTPVPEAEESTPVPEIVDNGGTEMPLPLVLSGNGEDEYITTKPEYVEGERIVLFLDEGVKVYGDTMILLEKIIDIAEKESGLYLVNDSPFSCLSGSDVEWLFGPGAFPGVDTESEKLHVYVVEYKKCAPCALGYGIVLNPTDLEIAAGDGFAMVHETLHCLQMNNGVQMDSIMDEGFATYLTGRICDRDEELTFSFNATFNYSWYDREITRENAEAIFCEEKDDNWENYLYGFRFVTYLYEAYGEDIFVSIMKDAETAEREGERYLTSAEVMPVVKRNTSDTVFEDFAEWLEDNRDRFEEY